MPRRNPWSTATIAVTTIAGTVAAAGAGAYVIRKSRRRREERAPIDTVAPESGSANDVDEPRGGPERPSEPPPVPTTTGELPAVILAGGVPLEAGWETVAWYRYPPSSNSPFWIRVDQYGVPTWSEWSSGDLNLDDKESPFHNEHGKPLTHGHFGRIEGAWRWTVVAGEATPLATERLDGAYLFRRPIIYLRYDRSSLENGMIDYAAQRAADWIDGAYGL